MNQPRTIVSGRSVLNLNFKLAQVEERLQTEVPDFTRNRMLERWEAISDSPPPPDEVYGKHKFWYRNITEQSFSMILANYTSQIDKARILASQAAILATGATHRPSHPWVCVCQMKPYEKLLVFDLEQNYVNLTNVTMAPLLMPGFCMVSAVDAALVDMQDTVF